MNNAQRWAMIAAALLLAAVVGVIAYNAGIAAGVEDGGKVVAGHWHPHWGGGFFLFPLFFIAFWILVIRGLFWRRGWHACGGERLDEWHRRAHERMWNEPQQ